MKWLTIIFVVLTMLVTTESTYAQVNCAELEIKLQEVGVDIALTFVETNKINSLISDLNKSLDFLIDEMHRTRIAYNLALKDPMASTTEIAQLWGAMMRAEKALDDAVAQIAELNESLLKAQKRLEDAVKERTRLNELYDKYCKPAAPNPPVPVPE